MERSPSWNSNSAGAGGQASRGGLSRFHSAPAGPWLESLIEAEESDPMKSNQNFTELLVASTVPLPAVSPSTSSSTSPALLQPGHIHRQNSSPVDFLRSSGTGNDGYFSSFGLSSNFDSSPSTNVSFSPSGERSGQLHGAESSVMDMDMEKLLEDSVPCRVRAKRGFATHPRSIAERMRRTRISDRIRKLQELVPNMDKQTNTADMLDEAVEYVKTLQKQIQELSEHQSKCTCVSKK